MSREQRASSSVKDEYCRMSGRQTGGEEKLRGHSKPELVHSSPCVRILDLQHSQPPACPGTARWVVEGGSQEDL